MVRTDRFITMETYKQPEIQPDSPVYIHCSRRCMEQSTGAMFLQVRLVNRTNEPIQTVILQIEGLSECGVVLYTMRDVILAECNARPHTAFGENKILALEHTPVHRVRITVERVAYEDGIIWRRQSGQKLLSAQKEGWNACRCGMRNPPEATFCELCGRALREDVLSEAPVSLPSVEDFPEIQVPYIELEPPDEYAGTERPEPIVRKFYAAEDALPEEPEEEEHGAPGWLVVLLCVFGIIALVAVVGFLAYIFMQYLGKI